jgi:hypothetical protein
MSAAINVSVAPSITDGHMPRQPDPEKKSQMIKRSPSLFAELRARLKD